MYASVIAPTPEPYIYLAFCNGHYIKNCVYADEELGIAIVLEHDEEGNVILQEDKMPKRKLIVGEIKIKTIDELGMEK